MKTIIAITGPSGSGKTTLGNLLKENYNIIVPTHCTTRAPRSDDAIGFYRYLSHNQYAKLLSENKFLLSSGDGPEVKKIYGNFYGVLKEDCSKAFESGNTILLYVSYKDINQLLQLKTKFNVKIIHLTFKDVAKSVRYRLLSDKSRNHSNEDIENRVKIATQYEHDFAKQISKNADLVIYTDLVGIQETYNKVINYLSQNICIK